MANNKSPQRDQAAIIINEMLTATMRGCTVAELVEKTGVSVATVRRVLLPLRKSGKVRSYKDPYDGRHTRYQLASNITPMPRRR